MTTLPKNIVEELKQKLTGTIMTEYIDRLLYSTDASMFKIIPAAVVIPQTANDIKETILLAKKHGISVAPRGGGTGLAGESLTDGIIIDLSVHMNKIKSIDTENNIATVQAGVIHGLLNKELASTGKIFGPDPATSSRCTIGGMIANNSTGAHSLVYGMTEHWIRSLTIMLSDGEIIKIGKRKRPLKDISQKEKEIYEQIIPLLAENKDLIEKNWPKTPRNRHGYLLKNVMNEHEIDLSRLFSASEGTLGILLEAELKVSNICQHIKLVCFMFENRFKATDATPLILKSSPSAVEIIDEVCMDIIRDHENYKDLFSDDVKSLLLVEFHGQSKKEVDNKIAQTISKIVESEKIATGFLECHDKKIEIKIWEMRKLIAGMLNRFPGKLQPVPIIEDACVSPSNLTAYLRGVNKILNSRGMKYLCFGHAGDGTIHIRPFLDLENDDTYEELPIMCEEVYDLTLSLGGTISGEHGDGFLRAPFIKKQYGSEVFELFKKIKNIFDPAGIFNPDKKTGCQQFATWKDSLKYKSNKNWKMAKETEFLASPSEHLKAIAHCNGCGACRSVIGDSDMCPIFRVHGTEAASTRAKVNLAKSIFSGELNKMKEKDIKKILEIADYCLNCKMCERECPGGVDAAELVLEIKAECFKKLGRPFEIRILEMMESILNLGSFLPRITNFISGLKLVQKIVELITGISSKRIPPKLSLNSFRRRNRKKHDLHQLTTKTNNKIRVAYFTDMFADIVDTKLSESFVKVLRHNQIEVVVPEQLGSGIIPINYSNVKSAKKIAEYNVKKLLPYVNAGYKIVCTEPTAALVLKKEYLTLSDHDNFKKIANNTMDAISFLHQLKEKGKLKTDFQKLDLKVAHHTPCHQKSLTGISQVPSLLKLIPGLKLKTVNEGCCGIAGTFGMREKKYDTSMQIGDNLFKSLSKIDIDFAITECSTCKMQIEHGVPSKKVIHPIILIAKAYKLD